MSFEYTKHMLVSFCAIYLMNSFISLFEKKLSRWTEWEKNSDAQNTFGGIQIIIICNAKIPKIKHTSQTYIFYTHYTLSMWDTTKSTKFLEKRLKQKQIEIEINSLETDTTTKLLTNLNKYLFLFGFSIFISQHHHKLFYALFVLFFSYL